MKISVKSRVKLLLWPKNPADKGNDRLYLAKLVNDFFLDFLSFLPDNIGFIGIIGDIYYF
jgi:hypothetical protein